MNIRFNLKSQMANVGLLAALTCLLASPVAAQNKGDAAAGKVLADKAQCVLCHGWDGNGNKGIADVPFYQAQPIPRISAQPQGYFIKSMHEYKSGKRIHEEHQTMTEHFSEDDIRNLAAWYGSQTPRAEPTYDYNPHK